MKKTIFALIVLNILAFFALRMVVAIAPAAPEPDPVPTHSENKQFIRLHVRANSDSESDQNTGINSTALTPSSFKYGIFSIIPENVPG